MVDVKSNKEDLSVYLHWPFCLSKCPYCDFMSVPLADSICGDDFGGLLLEDLKYSLNRVGDNRVIRSVFFGGGTPSLMSVDSVSNILNFLRKNYETDENIEITLEANPATFDQEKISAFKSAGINRISLGIQSFSDDCLKFLGRIYDSNQALSAAEIVAKNFENFSLDFMYGYECQTLDCLMNDLKLAVDFGTKHISCYQLTIEEGTPFYKKFMRGDIKQFPEDKSVLFYNSIEDFLGENDIFRYEVSNYAKQGFECRHNIAYWKYRDYLGVGPSAHGRLRINSSKYATEKISDPFVWAEYIEEGKETYANFSELSDIEIFQEMVITGLRMREGVNLSDFYKELPKGIVDSMLTEKKLRFLEGLNFLKSDSERLFLTDDGILHLNSVIEFLCNDA